MHKNHQASYNSVETFLVSRLVEQALTSNLSGLVFVGSNQSFLQLVLVELMLGICLFVDVSIRYYLVRISILQLFQAYFFSMTPRPILLLPSEDKPPFCKAQSKALFAARKPFS